MNTHPKELFFNISENFPNSIFYKVRNEPTAEDDIKYTDLHQVWHTYKEFPSNNGEEWENKRIIYKTEKGYFNCVTVGDHAGWRSFVINNKLEEWAYVEELYYGRNKL